MAAFAYAGAAQALRDPEHALVKFVGATVTPEAAVYAGGRVVYRGRIDDRYVDLGVERPAATQHDLADALAASLDGKPAPHPPPQAVGCFIADFARCPVSCSSPWRRPSVSEEREPFLPPLAQKA